MSSLLELGKPSPLFSSLGKDGFYKKTLPFIENPKAARPAVALLYQLYHAIALNYSTRSLSTRTSSRISCLFGDHDAYEEETNEDIGPSDETAPSADETASLAGETTPPADKTTPSADETSSPLILDTHFSGVQSEN
jgi:hypothetical protein